MKWAVAIRFGGVDRKLLHLERTNAGDYYAYFRDPERLPGVPPIDHHVSYHASGRHHFVLASGGRLHPAAQQTIAMRQPTSSLRGVELLVHAVGLKGQLETLSDAGNHKGPIVLLDADHAGFRDDAFFLRVFLVEPTHEAEIPTAASAGPRVVYLLKNVTPWIAIEAFQEACG